MTINIPKPPLELLSSSFSIKKWFELLHRELINIVPTDLVRPLNTITEDTPITDSYYIVLIDSSSSNVTATLPASPTTKAIFGFKCVDATNTVTINTNSKEVDGSASNITMSLNDYIEILYTGTEWVIIRQV